MSMLRHARTSGVDAGLRLRALLLSVTTGLNGSARGLERALCARRIRATPFQDPLFIVGHYRSGTTLLHKLLAADPRFTSPDTFDVLLPGCPAAAKPVVRALLQRLCDALGARNPYFHDWPLRLDDPNEAEPALLAAGSRWSAYWGFVFLRDSPRLLRAWTDLEDPARREEWGEAYDAHLRWLAWRNGGGRMLVKDPMNTARVSVLQARYPAAQFVMLERDPVRVFVSMVRLWRDSVEPLWALHRIDATERYMLIYDHFDDLMSKWLVQWPHLDAGRAVVVRYDDLVRAPLDTIGTVYERLGLGPIADIEPALCARLAREQAYREHSEEGLESLPASVARGLADWRERLGHALASRH